MSSKTVFISYAHPDGLQLSKQLEDWLKSNEVGLLVFRDVSGLKWGDNWKRVIDTAIEDCFAMIIVLTPKAILSPFVTYEWAFALGQGKRILPLIVDKSITEKNLHPKMGDLQYRRFVNPTQEEWLSLKDKLMEFQTQDLIPPSVENAVRGLESYLTDERRRAIASLKKISHPAAIRAFKTAIHESYYPDVKAHAGLALAELTAYQDMDALLGLEQALLMGGPEFSDAKSALIEMNNTGAAQTLIDAHHCMKQEYEKQELQDTLARFTNPHVAPYLREIWNTSGFKRTSIIEKLAIFRDEEILNEIIDMVKTRDRHKTHRALNLLRMYGDYPKAVDVIFEMLDEHKHANSTWDREILSPILEAIEQIPSQIVVDQLRKVLQEPSYGLVMSMGNTVANRMQSKLNESETLI